MDRHIINVNLPMTPERADIYQIDYEADMIEVEVIIDDFTVEFEEYDFWTCNVLEASELLPDGREIPLTEDELIDVADELGDGLAENIDPSGYYPEIEYDKDMF